VDAGALGYNPANASGVDAAVIHAHIRQGEIEGGMLDCIFRVLLAVSTRQHWHLVIFCDHGKHRSACGKHRSACALQESPGAITHA
jgi:hypothetical protein